MTSPVFLMTVYFFQYTCRTIEMSYFVDIEESLGTIQLYELLPSLVFHPEQGHFQADIVLLRLTLASETSPWKGTSIVGNV